MKRILFLSVMLVLACLCISACSCQSEESVTVTFENYTGEKIPAKTVLVGERIDEPDISKERAGYVFIGWFNGDKLWDFRADTVTQDIILTARWEKYLSFAEATDGSGGLWVTGCLFDAVNVVIPSEYNGRAVTGIYQGFADRTSIQSVIIPNTVTYISENAFAGCTGLKEIHIPKSVTKIDKNAFLGCRNMAIMYCEAEDRPALWHEDFNLVGIDEKSNLPLRISALYGVKN